jgi:hypothetical protein
MCVPRAREAVSSIEIPGIPAVTINFRWNAGSRASRVFPRAWRTMKALCRDHFRFAPDTRGTSVCPGSLPEAAKHWSDAAGRRD